MKSPMPLSRRSCLFILFTLSGFTGLIYESIWTQYMKLFLGHAAYAQTLVLAIFMGGLTAGSWLCSAGSHRWGNLLQRYALAEGAIGLLAILFHPAFDHLVGFSYAVVIPALDAPGLITAYKWTAASLLILPQTVLLGMTFPLMSAALLRLFPDTPGRSIALLYFTNSIGAAIGVLVSGFVLVRQFGLPGTISLAGVLNLAIAVAMWLLAGTGPADLQPTASAIPVRSDRSAAVGPRALLILSLATGMASFIYEIGWIRMLSLVLGSSTHSFELMLSAFIFGLAFGGLWVQRRIDRSADLVRFLALVQVTMGVMAVATLPVYGRSFAAMQWLIATLPKTGPGYALFNLSGNALALGVMLPATFCAGMTLPLITAALIRQGRGERSIGQVYAMNTVGAIAGVFFAIHVGLPLLGLRGSIIAGACLDMSLGLFLLWRGRSLVSGARQPAGIALLCVVVVAIATFSPVDQYSMASGVFRHGRILKPKDTALLFHRDGKTATVSVDAGSDGVVGIRTNGKTDAGIMMAPGKSPTADEATMILAAVLPVAYQPQAKTAAVIGMGSGLTTHTLLGDPRLTRVDTIEIEKEMIAAARLFGRRVERGYLDPRSALRIDDAKTFFSSHNAQYDIIVSEPSNPWVSGVAGLFSDEFYRLVRTHLNEEGIFVQWLQLYEIDMDLVASVMKAIALNFPDYEVYAPNSGDSLIIAGKSGVLPRPDASVLAIPAFAEALERAHIRSAQDLESRRIGDRGSLAGFFAGSALPANSDYRPVLDQNAARARFLLTNAQDLLRLGSTPLPLVDLLSPRRAFDAATLITYSPEYQRTRLVQVALALRDFMLTRAFVLHGAEVPAELREYAVQADRMLHECGSAVSAANRLAFLFNTAKNTIPYLTPDDGVRVLSAMQQAPCSASLLPVEKRYLELFRAIAVRDAAALSAAASALLETERDITPARLKYVLAADMLANISRGRRAAAASSFARFGPAALGAGPPDFLFRYLDALSREPR
jgi:spermidine synthase